MVPHQNQGKICTVTVPHDVYRAQAELLDDRCRIIGHQFIGQRPWAIRAMTMPSLIDADDRAIGHEVIPLTCKAVVEKDCPAVQKYDGRTVAARLRVQLSAPYLVVTLRATGLAAFAAAGASAATAATAPRMAPVKVFTIFASGWVCLRAITICHVDHYQ